MKDQYNQFWSVMSTPGEIQNDADRELIITFGSGLYNAILDGKLNKDAAATLTDHMIAAANMNPGRKQIVALCLLSVLGQKPDLYREAVMRALNLPDLLIEERVGMLCTFYGVGFNERHGADILHEVFTDDILYQFFEATVRILKHVLQENGRLAPVAPGTSRVRKPGKKRALIVGQQFLRPPHAPSRDMLDFARLLQSDYDFECMIMPTLEFAKNNVGTFLPVSAFNVDASYTGRHQISYHDQMIDLYQTAQPNFSATTAYQLTGLVEEFDPDMILAVGGFSHLAELFADRCFVFTYPTTAGVPLVRQSYFHTWRPPSESDLAKVKAMGLEDYYLFHQHPGFELDPAAGSYSRDTYDLPEDAFVIAVTGMRLHTDVRAKFVDEVMRPLCEDEKVHFWFMGGYQGAGSLLDFAPDLAGRFSYKGFEHDVRGAIRLADAFLNPDRTGGGSGIISAMAEGVPSYSLNRGDAYEAVRSHKALASYGDMVEAVRHIKADPTAYAEARDEALQSAERLTTRRPLLERIIAAFEDYQASNAN